MITDSDSDFVFLADTLKEREPFCRALLQVLERNDIPFSFPPGTKDIWAVDYMPVQIRDDKLIQFEFNPDYLRSKRWGHLRSDPHHITAALRIPIVPGGLTIDGGNVIRGDGRVILTDKIIRENPHLSSSQVISSLEQLLEVRVIIIPREPNDYTGHADGLVRYYDHDTVLVNRYDPKDHPEFQRKLTSALKSNGLNSFEVTYNPYLNQDNDSAVGLYINSST